MGGDAKGPALGSADPWRGENTINPTAQERRVKSICKRIYPPCIVLFICLFITNTNFRGAICAEKFLFLAENKFDFLIYLKNEEIPIALSGTNQTVKGDDLVNRHGAGSSATVGGGGSVGIIDGPTSESVAKRVQTT